MGKMLIVAGVVLIVAGLFWTLGERFGLGRLPGDFMYERGNMRVYFPFTTSILLSIIASVVFWLLRR